MFSHGSPCIKQQPRRRHAYDCIDNLFQYLRYCSRHHGARPLEIPPKHPKIGHNPDRGSQSLKGEPAEGRLDQLRKQISAEPQHESSSHSHYRGINKSRF